MDEKRKNLKNAEKTGEVIGKCPKKGWGAIKGVGKGLKKGFSKKSKKNINFFYLKFLHFCINLIFYK
jgi:hypothetical protein